MVQRSVVSGPTGGTDVIKQTSTANLPERASTMTSSAGMCSTASLNLCTCLGPTPTLTVDC